MNGVPSLSSEVERTGFRRVFAARLSAAPVPVLTASVRAAGSEHHPDRATEDDRAEAV